MPHPRFAQANPTRAARPILFRPMFAPVSEDPQYQARESAVFHDGLPVDDDSLDIVTNTAFDQALHRISHRSESQTAAAGKVDNNDVGERSGR